MPAPGHGTRVDADGTPNPTGGYLAPPFDYSTCVDRDKDGLIRTSIGLGDILPWPNVTDAAGGSTALVEDAEDECIQIFQVIHGSRARHVSVDANNNVWTSGNQYRNNAFDLLDGDTGEILSSFDINCGGYGGLIDGNGVLWSANRGPTPMSLLRYETKNTVSTADDVYSILTSPSSYGLALDLSGNIWNTQYSNSIYKYDSSGALLGVFQTGGAGWDRGVVVTPADDDVWVANSAGSDVSRLSNSGGLVKVIPLGADGLMPTGVAVDSQGKVWATCWNSDTVKRIDPNGGADGLGAVDLTVDLGVGAGPYNYGDMTGTVLLQAIQQGAWTVIFDTGVAGTSMVNISWTSHEPDGTAITTEARAADSEVGLNIETFEGVSNGGTAAGVTGRFWQVMVNFSREATDVTPILFDLTFGSNTPPECPDGMEMMLWPPTHRPVAIDLDALAGVTDPDGDPVFITITSITQDEPLNDLGDGNTTCDGQGVGDSVAHIRAERQGLGNGRVYHINYTASDGLGGGCDGTFVVRVPQSKNGDPVIDDGQAYDSTACFGTADVNGDGRVSLLDYEIVLNNMGAAGPDENLNWPDGDVDRDGVVTGMDLKIVLGIIYQQMRRSRFGFQRR